MSTSPRSRFGILSAEVLAASGDRRLVESVNFLTVLGDERDVRRRDRFQVLRLLEARRTASEPELGFVATEAARLTEVHQRLHAERRECLLVERFGARVVAHRERDVIDDRHVCACGTEPRAFGGDDNGANVKSSPARSGYSY